MIRLRSIIIVERLKDKVLTFEDLTMGGSKQDKVLTFCPIIALRYSKKD